MNADSPDCGKENATVEGRFAVMALESGPLNNGLRDPNTLKVLSDAFKKASTLRAKARQ